MAAAEETDLNVATTPGGSVGFRIRTYNGVLITWPQCPVEPLEAGQYLLGHASIGNVGERARIGYLEIVRELHTDGGFHLHGLLVPVEGHRLQLDAKQFTLPQAGGEGYKANVRVLRTGRRNVCNVVKYIRKDLGDAPDPRDRYVWGDDSYIQEKGEKRGRRDLVWAEALEQATCQKGWEHLLQHSARDAAIYMEAFKAAYIAYHGKTLGAADAVPAELPFNVPDRLQEWAASMLDTSSTARRILFLFDYQGGRGKSTWARSLGKHDYLSGECTNRNLHDDAEFRIWDDIKPETLRLVLDLKTLHQKGMRCETQFGKYSRPKIVNGSHSIFLSNYDPKSVIPLSLMTWYETHGLFLEITEPLFLLASATQQATCMPTSTGTSALTTQMTQVEMESQSATEGGFIEASGYPV